MLFPYLARSTSRGSASYLESALSDRRYYPSVKGKEARRERQALSCSPFSSRIDFTCPLEHLFQRWKMRRGTLTKTIGVTEGRRRRRIYEKRKLPVYQREEKGKTPSTPVVVASLRLTDPAEPVPEPYASSLSSSHLSCLTSVGSTSSKSRPAGRSTLCFVDVEGMERATTAEKLMVGKSTEIGGW